jgi:WD domain, G-beta repeat
MRLGHEQKVNAIAFSRDGHYLATACDDKSARVWEVESSRKVTRLVHEHSVRATSFSPDGEYLATATFGDTIRLWLVWPEDLIAEAGSRLTRNLTLTEWQQYLGADVAYERTCPNLPPGEGAPTDAPTATP